MRVKLITACGCTKDQWVERPYDDGYAAPIVRVVMQDRLATRWDPEKDPMATVTYRIRDFKFYRMERDDLDRELGVYHEVLEKQNPDLDILWKQKYETLYKSVYGMDEGL